MDDIFCVYEAKDLLGEGPIWNELENKLYWCDNLRPCIHRYDPANGEVKTWPMKEEVGSLVFRKKDGKIVAGMKSGFAFLDLDAGTVDYIVNPEPETGNCLNDGKVDRAGRYWCGTINRDLKTKNGALYRLDTNLTSHKMDYGVIASNGIAFSPDDKTMYFSDSRSAVVWAYDLDIASGEISNKRVFIENTKVDGATVDTEGNYWCAHVHEWHVGQHDPKGRLIRKIKMPVRQPTMCTFGGEKFDILYVTSTRNFLQPDEAETTPLAGSLFAIHNVGARGYAEPRFGG
jgi:L-arabinonolactonase